MQRKEKARKKIEVSQSSPLVPVKKIIPSKSRYNQNILVRKINEDRKSRRLSLVNEGQCHGLSLLWVKNKDDGEGPKFYRIRKDIIDLPIDKFKKKEVDAFVKEMRNYQSPEKKDANLSYADIGKIIHAEQEINLDDNYLIPELADLLRKNKKNYNMICISSVFPNSKQEAHTVAVYIENNWYVYFDANNDHEKARRYSTAQNLTEHIQRSLYDNFGYIRPTKMELEIKVVSNPSKHALDDNITKKIETKQEDQQAESKFSGKSSKSGKSKHKSKHKTTPTSFYGFGMFDRSIRIPTRQDGKPAQTNTTTLTSSRSI